MYCLSSDFTACPVYRNLKVAPPPPKVTVRPDERAALTRKVLIAAAILAVLLVGSVATAFAWWNGWGPFSNTGLLASSANGINGNTAGLPGLLVFGQATPQPGTTSTLSGIIPQTGEQQPVANCPMPPGWTVYAVKPTDSLHLLSLLYRVDVNLLRQANCLDVQDIILPGQRLYVPVLPTSTPTLTPTPRPSNTATFPPVIVVQPTNPPPDVPVVPPTASKTATISPTNTNIPPSATVTPFPTRPWTRTPIPTQVPTIKPTEAPKPTETPKPTKTPRPTRFPPRATPTATLILINPTAVPTATAVVILPSPTNTEPIPTSTTAPTQPLLDTPTLQPADTATPQATDTLTPFETLISTLTALITGMMSSFGWQVKK